MVLDHDTITNTGCCKIHLSSSCYSTTYNTCTRGLHWPTFSAQPVAIPEKIKPGALGWPNPYFVGPSPSSAYLKYYVTVDNSGCSLGRKWENAQNRWAALVSCSCIRSLEFSAIGHSVITFFNCFTPPAEDISLSQIIPSHSIVSPYTPSWSQ